MLPLMHWKLEVLSASIGVSACDAFLNCCRQGDPPNNMKKFWKLLLRKNLPANVLLGTSYAVFGLGDSGYVKYNVRECKILIRNVT